MQPQLNMLMLLLLCYLLAAQSTYNMQISQIETVGAEILEHVLCCEKFHLFDVKIIEKTQELIVNFKAA